MKDRIQTENWIQRGGKLLFSERCEQLSLRPEETGEGMFTIREENGKLVEGFVWTEDERMTCLNDSFSGKEEQVEYRFDSAGMGEGDEWHGRFFIVSNVGEYELPYTVRIQCGILQSSVGEVKNLFHFANLARTNWTEAVRLFYHQEFIRVFEGADAEYRNLYQGMSRSYGNEQNVEEFLMAVRKKQPVEYIVENEELLLAELRGNASEDIIITRNGWGYTNLSVETEGDFLHCEKNTLGDDDFLGNQCRLPVFLNGDGLHAGKNFGMVKLTYSKGQISVPVTVLSQDYTHVRNGRYREMKKLTLRMVQLYQDFRMKRLSLAGWSSTAMEVVEKMKQMSEQNPVPRLFQAHLLLTEERMDEAGWILEHMEKELNDSEPEVYAYYLYLTTLYRREDSYVAEMADRVMELHRCYSENWKIAWLLLFLSREVNRSMTAKWQFLEEQLTHCTSPVLYLEAVLLLNGNPTLVMNLDSVEMRVLYYGAKKGILSDDLIGHVVYLAGKQRYFNETVYRILKLCYEKKPTDELLYAICVLLIKGNRSGADCYPWYLKSVEKELRITRLFEYYMMSIDLDEDVEIPKMVLLYFAYQSNLDADRAAYLYAYVDRQKEEEPELYLSYKSQIDRFVVQQLYRGKINRHLAYLYQSVLEGHLFTDDNCQALAPLLFLQQVDCSDTTMRQVVVIHRQLKGEKCYPIVGGRAYVPVYGRNTLLLLEDEKHNRYVQSVPYQISKLMSPTRSVGILEGRVKGNFGYDLFRCSGIQDEVRISEENEEHFAGIACQDEISGEYGNQVRAALLRWYFEKDRLEELDALLQKIVQEQIAESDRLDVCRLFVLRGFYEKAYEWMRGVQIDRQDARILMRLGSRLLEREKYADEPLMTRICYTAFSSGKYDSRILEHLSDVYRGSTIEMKKLLRAADNFEVDTYRLTERILVQMLYTGEPLQTEIGLLRAYVSAGGNGEIETAVLHRLAYGYVMQEKDFAAYAVAEILHMVKRGEEVSEMCALAFLQYYEEHRDLRSREVDQAAAVLGTFLLKKNIHLPILKSYASLVPGAELLLDKTFIVYKGRKESPAVLHYKLRSGKEETEVSLSTGMHHLFDGIYMAEFILFAGEEIQYFVVEGSMGKEAVDSGTVKAGESSVFVKGSRYGLLNDVTSERLRKEDGDAAAMLERYLQMDFMTEKLFSSLK